MERKFELLESPLDERDYVYGNICNGSVDLPEEYLVDTGIERNQMSTNHCASYSQSYIATADIKEKHGEDVILSPMFIHMNAKKNDRMPEVTGSSIKDTSDSICKYGVCLESDYPSINLLTNDFPKCSEDIYKKALKYKQDGYAQVSRDVDSIKRAIYDNNGCVCHMRLFKDYYNDCWLDKPSKQENSRGAHALAIVGWSDKITHTYPSGIIRKGYFIIRDSYGNASRTNKSYIYLPYEAVTDTWCGMYSDPDRIIKEIWTTYTNSKVVLPDYYKHNQDKNHVGLKPNKTIKMKLKSNIAYVDGVECELDVTPVAENGVTFVPLAFISKMLGHHTRWYSDEKQVNIFAKKLNKNVDMWIGNCKAKNGKEDYYFIEPPCIKDGRTMIPIRSCEMLNSRVDYNPSTKEITIIEQ